MAARRKPDPAPSLVQLGPLGIIVASLQPLHRKFLRAAVATTAAASVATRDRRLILQAIDQAFAEIEVVGRETDRESESEPETWLRRQLEGLS